MHLHPEFPLKSRNFFFFAEDIITNFQRNNFEQSDFMESQLTTAMHRVHVFFFPIFLLINYQNTDKRAVSSKFISVVHPKLNRQGRCKRNPSEGESLNAAQTPAPVCTGVSGPPLLLH